MSAPHRFLMCSPDFYEDPFVMHPGPKVRVKVNPAKARRQWTALYDLLVRKLNVQIDLLEPVNGLPDLVFTASAGLLCKRMFVRSGFRQRERQGEEKQYETWFKKKGYIVKALPPPFCFEGALGAFWMGEELYMGYHLRADLESCDWVSGILERPCFPLEICDTRFHHLHRCLSPLNAKSALFYPGAFETCARLLLFENIEDPVEISEKEALQDACSVIALEKDVILSEGCPKTAREIKKRGFKVHELDLSEFRKAGGTARSLVFQL